MSLILLLLLLPQRRCALIITLSTHHVRIRFYHRHYHRRYHCYYYYYYIRITIIIMPCLHAQISRHYHTHTLTCVHIVTRVVVVETTTYYYYCPCYQTVKGRNESVLNYSSRSDTCARDCFGRV